MSTTTSITRGIGVPDVPAWTAQVVCVAGRAVTSPPAALAPITVVGRSPRAVGVVLDDEGVAPLHAEIVLHADTIRVDGWGGLSVEVDGRSASSAALVHGSVLVIGDSVFIVRHTSVGRTEDACPSGLEGTAPAMRTLRRAVLAIAPTDCHVLITGERGTGKELVARALHAESRRPGRFVVLPARAFASPSARGRAYEEARAGTLLLSHVDALSLEEQLDLVERHAQEPSVRLLCSTRADLLERVESGSFHGEVHARIGEFSLVLPPLRERREDLLALLEAELGEELPALSGDRLRSLFRREWPENLREVRRAAGELRGRDDPRSSTPDRSELEALLASHGPAITAVATALSSTTADVHAWLVSAGIDEDRYRF